MENKNISEYDYVEITRVVKTDTGEVPTARTADRHFIKQATDEDEDDLTTYFPTTVEWRPASTEGKAIEEPDGPYTDNIFVDTFAMSDVTKGIYKNTKVPFTSSVRTALLFKKV